jgi:phosphate transport system permease protein
MNDEVNSFIVHRLSFIVSSRMFMERKKSFTGHSRRRTTRLGVRLVEFLSRWLIRIGGIGTIVAVILVGVFLVWVAAPLFCSSSLSAPRTLERAAPPASLLRSGVDEYLLLGWELYADGSFLLLRLDNGQVLQQKNLFPGARLTACSPQSKTEEIVFGFRDGKVRQGRIHFKSRFVNETDLVDEALRKLSPGEIAEYDGGLLQRLPDGQLRHQKLVAEIQPPDVSDNTRPIVLIDQTRRGAVSFVTLLTRDGQLRTYSMCQREHPATAEIVTEQDGGKLELPPRPGKGLPSFLLISGVGDNVFAAWNDGHALRISTRDLEKPSIVEEFDLLDREDAKLTALQFLIGKTTLLAGDDAGRIRAWFRVKQSGTTDGDGNAMIAAHDFGSVGASVNCLGVSSRTRLFAAGYENGQVRLYSTTTEKRLAETQAGNGQPIRGVLIAPKDDAVVFRTPEALLLSNINAEQHHPEVTPGNLMQPVWYEGYEKPAHVWQPAGDDGYEPKFGFWPLIFGTLKATFYSLLMGVPLALLAAIYTSEFLHSRAKAIVKPTVEMMASLPSVVLGFLAALVLAPFVEHWLAAVIASFVTLPGAFVLGAYLWQLLPDKLGLVLSRYRFVFLMAVLPLGIVAAALAGPLLEKLLFQGDLKAWLNGSGSSTPGWLLLLLPFSVATSFLLLAQVVNPRLRPFVRRLSRFQQALLDIAKFVGAAVGTVALAWLGGLLLAALGFDPRGSFVGTFVQRNALVVGFMMGFAIIPIIFTIAEDALSAVPEHLRSASLGCGATPWQTATRIIIPTALSGLFSAVMIGLGRAVGETMIVLMAAGGTPIMELNLFNGFRTLSANIAVELPEAVKDSTHYRTLFLAALTLFALTFLLNTIAEVIRQRFRKRAFQL